jgi:hypothetical protein
MLRFCSPGSSAVLLLAGLLVCAPAAAQQPADSVRAAALRDYHGPDGQGKDGPLAKAGLDLLLLYHQYEAFEARGGDGAFTPSGDLPVTDDGHVRLEAIAAEDVSALRADLEALGLRDAATAGRVVSGQFPIDSIPALAQTESLRGVTTSQMQTRDRRSPATPSRAQPPNPPEPPPPPPGRGDGESDSAASPGDGGIASAADAGVFLLVLSGLLLGLEQ